MLNYKNKSYIKLIALSLMIGVLLSLCITVVSAVTWTAGPILSFTVWGTNYQAQNEIWVSQNTAFAYTLIRSANLQIMPIGYMGAVAYLYTSGGAMVAWSDWWYNSIATNYMSRLTFGVSNPGTYFSSGFVRAFNGNGYTTREPNRTPNMAIR